MTWLFLWIDSICGSSPPIMVATHGHFQPVFRTIALNVQHDSWGTLLLYRNGSNPLSNRFGDINAIHLAIHGPLCSVWATLYARLGAQQIRQFPSSLKPMLTGGQGWTAHPLWWWETTTGDRQWKHSQATSIDGIIVISFFRCISAAPPFVVVVHLKNGQNGPR